MKVLFAPEPHGGGTAYAESFLSIVHRTCAIYRVSLGAMFRLLLALDPKPTCAKGIQSPGAFLAYSSTTATLATQFSRLAGSTVYANHTLLKLRDVLARTCCGVISSRVRWCPDCLNPQSGPGYGLLAHHMEMLDACPLHRRVLRTRCVVCRKLLTISHASPLCTDCPHCQASLASADPRERTAPALDSRAQHVLDVVAYATDPELSPPPATWSEEVQAGLQYLIDLGECSYDRSELRTMQRGLRVDNKRLTLVSLLKLAEMQMLDPRALFTAPKQAFSARLPGMGPIPRRAQYRWHHPIDLWFALRRTALELIDLPPDERLPSLQAICNLAGTSHSGFWQHFPQVSADYNAERKARLRGRGPAPVACLFAQRYPLSPVPVLRGPELPGDALEAACDVIDRNLSRWLRCTRAPLVRLTS